MAQYDVNVTMRVEVDDEVARKVEKFWERSIENALGARMETWLGDEIGGDDWEDVELLKMPNAEVKKVEQVK
jgi:hypothetical protein